MKVRKTACVVLLCALVLAGCSSQPTQPTERTDIIDVIVRAAENPRGVDADVEFVIVGVGEGSGYEAGRWFLNSEPNYRDFRSLNIIIHPRVVQALREAEGVEYASDLLGRRVRVQGQAFRVQINFSCQGRVTEAHYFQTHLPVARLRQIEFL